MTKIALVGEAWGNQEEEEQRPFVGQTGYVLRSFLAKAGIAYSDCFVTSTFKLRPQPRNDLVCLCGPKTKGIAGYPALRPSKYVREEFAGELTRLYAELEREKPNVIVALGNAPLWALLKITGITKYRGAPVDSPYGKVLPTYSPTNVNKDWGLSPVFFADLAKAKHESEFPEVRRPFRELWLDPTIEDLYDFRQKYIIPNPRCAADIETSHGQITCISFAPTREHAIVVPFYDPEAPGGNYWTTLEEELEAWSFVRTTLAMRKGFTFQNGLYDLQYLWRTVGITVPHAEHDTMLLHHALQPEMRKGLAFLGTLYTNEATWKLERKSDTLKRED